jgi:hypothetical protein
MALYMQENNCTAGNSIKEFAKKAEEYFRLIYDLYYSFDEKIIITITKQREEFKETERLFFKNKSKEEIILFHFMFNAIIKIYEASSPIVGLHVGKSYGTK